MDIKGGNKLSVDDFLESYANALDAKDKVEAQRLVSQFTDQAREGAKLIHKKGLSSYKEGRLHEGIGRLEIALNIFVQLEDDLNTALMRNDLSVAYTIFGDKHSALAAARDAAQIFQHHRYEPGLKTTSETVSILFNSFSNKQALDQFLKEHLAFSRTLNLSGEYDRTMKDLQRIETLRDQG